MKLDEAEFEIVAFSFVMPCLAITKERISLNPEWKQSGSSERIASWGDQSKTPTGGWRDNSIPLHPTAGLIFDEPNPGLSFPRRRGCRVYLHMLAEHHSALTTCSCRYSLFENWGNYSPFPAPVVTSVLNDVLLSFRHVASLLFVPWCSGNWTH